MSARGDVTAWIIRFALTVLLAAVCGRSLQAQPVELSPALPSQEMLFLSDEQGSMEVWPYVSLLVDAQGSFTAKEVLQRLGEFERPTPNATLGVRKDAVWLYFQFKVAPHSEGRWILDINHPDLSQIDLLLMQGERIVEQTRLGTSVPKAQRPLPGRTPMMGLLLEAGQTYQMLLRVQTRGGMILPITLNTPTAMLNNALNEQMLQGVLTGLALCLICYSLAQWLSLREPLFIQYAVLTTGSMLYSMHYFGIGQQYLWGENAWLTEHAVGLASLVALAGSFLFMSQAIEGHGSSTRFLRGMRWCAWACFGLAVIYALDIVSLKTVATIISLTGPLPSVLCMPKALKRARAGDSIGVTLLIAWVIYALGSATSIALINGKIPVNFWTSHSFQLAATIDMLLFMRVLGLRTKELHIKATHASQERDAMRSLAHSDALTGLPNRRGLQMALSAALSRATPDNLLAVYVMDLDGFKPVNDQHGHDVGDELLVAATRRLQGHLRQSDVVARLGGDEFVVMTGQLQTPAQAHELGLKLLDAFNAPFSLGPIQVKVGLTIGYAIAPTDSQDAAGLIKLADAAMYSGKQSGKFCVRRNTGDLALSSV